MDLLNKLVVCEYAQGDVAFIGEAVSYMDFPTYDVKVGNEHKNWAGHLTREATMEEAVAYWKDRAEKAEYARFNADLQRTMTGSRNAAIPYNAENLNIRVPS